MADAPKLKDYFTDEVVRDIGERVAEHAQSFDVDTYVELVAGNSGDEPFDELTFTARSKRIAGAIDEVVGLEPPALFDLLTRSLPPEFEDSGEPMNDGFTLWPYGDAIATHAADFPDEALDACLELTKRFTAEFAIRPVLATSEDALDTVAGWTSDPNEHVRRLVSEGTRPRLPWATRLELPLDKILSMLTDLRADTSLYVRKSVANHLNDLAKDHPDQIIELLAGWHNEGVEETQWIVRHALRNHLKNGTPKALAILGYLPPRVELSDIVTSPAAVAIGETVDVSFSVSSTGAESQQLMIDMVMGYMKANGKPSPKVFKFRDMELAAGATEDFSTSYDMVVRSTRKLYPGEHSLTVRINGQDLATTTFTLT